MPPRSRHIPIRTCVVCGNKTAKADLVRIVATPQGNVAIDSTGRLPGRGAYVCKDGVCVRPGLKRGRIEHTLRAKLTDEDWSALTASLRALTES